MLIVVDIVQIRDIKYVFLIRKQINRALFGLIW